MEKKEESLIQTNMTLHSATIISIFEILIEKGLTTREALSKRIQEHVDNMVESAKKNEEKKND